MRAIISSTALSTGHLLVDDAVHRLGPDVLVVEDRELVVLRELEGHRAVLVLVVDRLPVRIGLPEGLFLRRLGDREPAPERALDIGRQVLFLQQELHELLRRRLVLGVGEDDADLDRGPVDHLLPSGFVREARRADQLAHSSSLPARAARRSASRCSCRRATSPRSRSSRCGSAPSSCCGRRRCCPGPSSSSRRAARSP